jgi:hypothetical protein
LARNERSRCAVAGLNGSARTRYSRPASSAPR